MQIKNTVQQILFTALFLVIISGCSDNFLDQSNPQSVNLDHIKDLESLTNAANGTYSKFQQSNYYNRTFILTPELIGDNVFISRKNNGRYLNQDNFTITDTDGYVSGAWSLMYDVVVNANLALARGTDIEFGPNEQVEADQVMGELYAARALAYFDLVRFFAQPYNYTENVSHDGVPLINEPHFEIISPPRASVAEVYIQIVGDLKRGEELMQPDMRDGHFTSVVAQALLAKVYLYMEDWENAELYASRVIDEGPYALLSNADYIGSWASKFTIESIFEISNTPNDNSGSNGIGYFTEQGGYGDALATEDLYNTYTSTDVRRQLIQPGSRVGGEEDAYFIEKYPNGAGSRDDNPKVLRLAEMYLIRAEARAELGKTSGAQDDLNKIIQRADPGAAAVTLTGDALVERIILERRKELAFEGNRLFDLNRKGMSVTLIQSDQTRVFEYPNDRFIMPIPYAEINANENIEQNPGWN